MDLIRAKLRRPVLPEDVLLRRRLVDRLAAGGRRNVLLVAPVGYGKTVLMAQVRLARDESSIWYRLDESDNAFRQFITYMAAAFELCFPGAESSFADLLAAPPDDLRADAAAERFLSLIEAATGRLTLFLDDIHVIRSEAVIQFLRHLAQYAGRALRIVMAADRPVPRISDLPLARRFIEWGVAELRFSREEAEAYLGVPLTVERAQRLEGWPFGLACLHRLGHETLRAESDALCTRILEQADPYERALLSVVAHFPHAAATLYASMIDVEADGRTADETLRELVARGWFLTASGDSFDLHPLIADVIRQKDPLDAVRRDTALEALIGAGRYAQAMALALENGDAAQAGHILQASRYELLSSVRADRLRYFGSMLSEVMLQQQPGLYLLAAGEALVRRDPVIFDHLAAARPHLQDSDDRDGLTWAGLLASAGHRHAHRFADAAAQIAAVFEHASAHPVAQVDLVIEIAALTDAAWPAMERYASWREHLYRHLDARAGERASLRLLAALALWLARDGNPEKAWNVHTQLSLRHGDYGASAEVLLQRFRCGGFEEATALFEEALHRDDLDGADPRREGRVLFLLGLGLCRRLAGDADAALELLSRGRQEALVAGDTHDAMRCDLEYIKTLCLQGHWDRGMGLAYEARLAVPPDDPVGIDLADACLATLSALHGLDADAEAYAGGVLRRATRGGVGYPALEATLVLAALAAAADDTTRVVALIGGVSAQLLPLAAAWLAEHGQTFAPFLAVCEKEKLMGTLLDVVPAQERQRLQEGQEPHVAPALQVRCFGAPTAKSMGRPVRWRTRKARDLFFFLVLHRGLKKSRASLIEAIFPEATEEQLVHQVKNTISVLRSSLNKAGFTDMVRSAGGYYWLDESRIDSDFEQFRAHLRALTGAGERDARLQALREACALHSGELCTDMEFVPLPRLRVQIAGQLESALLTAIQEQVAARDLEDARAFAEMLCAIAPDNRAYESICQALRQRTTA